MDVAGLSWRDDSVKALGNRIAVTSDSGFRGKTAGSSAAFVVWKLTVAARKADPIAICYEFWRNGRSAFEAEIVALDRALTFICNLCM